MGVVHYAPQMPTVNTSPVNLLQEKRGLFPPTRLAGVVWDTPITDNGSKEPTTLAAVGTEAPAPAPAGSSGDQPPTRNAPSDITPADDDALLSYDIRFSNKEGEIFQFTGHNMLHSFSAQQMLSEGPRNFEALLYTVLFRPLKAQVQNYLNTFVKNDNPLSGDHTFGLNDVRPEIREAGSGSFIATSG